jgi:hypothetical protein
MFMPRKNVIAALCSVSFILALTFLVSAYTAGAQETSNALTTGAQKVQVGLYVLNLGKFDITTGAFTADFYLDLRCDGPCPPGTLDGFEFMNGRASSIDKIIDEEGEKFYRIQATLSSPVDLLKYPFDSQKMEIIIEDKTKTLGEIVYVPDKTQSGIDDSIVFTGWNIDGWDAKAGTHEYKIYGETYSQFVFDVDISRIVLSSFLKTFLPVIFILLVVVFSFLLDPDKVTTRLTIAGSSLVAAVLFHVSINSQIPSVGYLTFADKFMIVTYLILLLSFIINILIIEFGELRKQKLVEKLHRSTEYSILIIVPVLYAILFLFFL